MQRDKSPVIVNILLAFGVAFAIYLGLLYMEGEQDQLGELAKLSDGLPKKPDTGAPIPFVNKTETQQQLSPAPLYIKDDVIKLINGNAPIKDVMKSYSRIGLDFGKESFTISLNSDGSVQDVSKSIDSGVDFTLKTNAESFRRLILLAQHKNLLGLVSRFKEMEFSPPSAKQEFVNKLNEKQGFTSWIRKPESSGLMDK